MKETLVDLKARRSIRSFRAEQVREEDLVPILEAGLYAPSGMNVQETKLVVVQDKALRDELSGMNAAVMGGNGDPYYGAPTVVLVFSDASYATIWKEDGALVMGNLLNAAYAQGVGSCWIHRCNEMFKTPRGKELKAQWGIPESYEGVGCCILGYAEGALGGDRERKANRIVRV